MMIRLLVPRAYWGNGKSEVQEIGQIVDVTPDEAGRMVEALQAEYVDFRQTANVEAAMVEVVAPRRRGRPPKMNVEIRNA